MAEVPAAAHMCRVFQPILPGQGRGEMYDEKYQLYLQVIQELDPLWDRLQEYRDRHSQNGRRWLNGADEFVDKGQGRSSGDRLHLILTASEVTSVIGEGISASGQTPELRHGFLQISAHASSQNNRAVQQHVNIVYRHGKNI